MGECVSWDKGVEEWVVGSKGEGDVSVEELRMDGACEEVSGMECWSLGKVDELIGVVKGKGVGFVVMGTWQGCNVCG